MSGEIVEGMIELPPSFVIPKLIAVETGAKTAALEFVSLWHAIYNDPRTERIANQFAIEGQAVHSVKPRTILRFKHISKTVFNGKGQVDTKVNKYGMDVYEADGDMTVSLDLTERPLANLANDEFAGLIMDYFRSHLARQAN